MGAEIYERVMRMADLEDEILLIAIKHEKMKETLEQQRNLVYNLMRKYVAKEDKSIFSQKECMQLENRIKERKTEWLKGRNKK